jgi:hypothetical protein
MKLLGAADEFVAVHLGHEEIAEDEIDGAWKGLFEELQCALCGECGEDAVATGFEQEGADGENLFVVIYTENRLLRAHAVSLLPSPPCGGLRPMDQSLCVCWFAGAEVRCGRLPRGSAEFGSSARGGSSASCGGEDRRARLSCLLHEGSGPPVRRA